MQNNEAEAEPKGSYVHFPSPMKSYFLSVLAILGSAIPGSVMAWLLVAATGWNGVVQAILTVMLAMVFSVAIFAGLIAAGRALGVSVGADTTKP